MGWVASDFHTQGLALCHYTQPAKRVQSFEARDQAREGIDEDEDISIKVTAGSQFLDAVI
jgi:hypothetical protein